MVFDCNDALGSKSHSPTTPGAAGASVNKMDVKDFMRAVELDDIFIQAIFRKSRSKIMNLMKKAESKYMSQLPAESTVLSPANLKANDASSKRKGGESDKLTRESRVNSADITTAVIEEELRAAFNQLKTSDNKPSKPAFPIANAVGK